MGTQRGAAQLALFLTILAVSAVVGSPHAMAVELGDYLWQRRPLLLFAPTQNDARLTETLSRIEAEHCDVSERDIVIGVVVTDGSSTLDRQALDADESQRLVDQYAIGESNFTALLIGKDGGEKWRTDAVPDLRTIYAVIDGMPMRSRETSTDPSQC